MWFLLLALCLQQPETNAGDAFRKNTAMGLQERGYSKVRYDLDHMALPVVVRIHGPLGCALLFDRPYDDTWASDAKGAGSGAYYSYLEWGVGADGTGGDHRKVIIANVVPTDTPVNVFFLFDDKVLEVLLLRVDTMAEADRVVKIQLVGGELVGGERPALPKAATVEKPEVSPDRDWLPMLTRTDNRFKTVAHGRLVYNFDRAPYFLYFTPHDHAPPVMVLEVIRATRQRWKKAFRFEYPVAAVERHTLGRNQLVLFPHFALDASEKLYLRSQVQGERHAKVTRLKQRRPR